MFLKIERLEYNASETYKVGEFVIISVLAITKIIPMYKTMNDIQKTKKACATIFLSDNKSEEVPYSIHELEIKLLAAMKGR